MVSFIYSPGDKPCPHTPGDPDLRGDVRVVERIAESESFPIFAFFLDYEISKPVITICNDSPSSVL